MNRHALIALGAVVLVASAGALALRSIDQDQPQSALANAEKRPAMTAEEAAKVLPTPSYVPDEAPPPPPPKFDGPIKPVLRFELPPEPATPAPRPKI
jgi:hypothetical protein